MRYLIDMVTNAQFYIPDPYARDKQFDKARHMTGAQRVQLICSLSAMEMLIIKQTIKRENPGASQEELDIIFVRTVYGEELAAALANYLAKRREIA